MRFAFILAEKAHFPIAFMCRHLGVSTSAERSFVTAISFSGIGASDARLPKEKIHGRQ